MVTPTRLGGTEPEDLKQQIRDELAKDPRQAWDDILYALAGGAVDDEDAMGEDAGVVDER